MQRELARMQAEAETCSMCRPSSFYTSTWCSYLLSVLGPRTSFQSVHFMNHMLCTLIRARAMIRNASSEAFLEVAGLRSENCARPTHKLGLVCFLTLPPESLSQAHQDKDGICYASPEGSVRACQLGRDVLRPGWI